METDKKKILINNDSLIRDIQNDFSACYPFLKIDFFVPGSKMKNSRSALLDPLISLKQLAGVNPGTIDINQDRTVAEVSQYLQDILGVTVKMCRKSGNVWSTISISDGWTLESQNIAGEFICSEMATDTIDPSPKN